MIHHQSFDFRADSRHKPKQTVKQNMPPNPTILDKQNWDFLNSIQIQQSRTTQFERYAFSKQQNSPIAMFTSPMRDNTPQCSTCKIWAEWAIVSEEKMLKIDAKLIQKQLFLNQLIMKLNQKLNQQHNDLIRLKQQQLNIKQQYCQKIQNLKSQNQCLKLKVQQLTVLSVKSNKQRSTQLTGSNKKTMNKYGYLKTVEAEEMHDTHQKQQIQYQVDKIDTLKTIKPMIQRYQGIRKSHTQQTVTDCSFFGDYPTNYQNQYFAIDKNGKSSNNTANSHNKLKNYRNPQNLQQQKRSPELTESIEQLNLKIKHLSFENENLRSYNKVLLQKLSKSKLRKY